jgi:hypothetical protein
MSNIDEVPSSDETKSVDRNLGARSEGNGKATRIGRVWRGTRDEMTNDLRPREFTNAKVVARYLTSHQQQRGCQSTFPQ